MCARYGSETEFNLLQKNYKAILPEIAFRPQEIIYPHRMAPVIVEQNSERFIQMMNYSLIPSWSKVRKPKFATYNARIEEVLNKPSWKVPFKTQHCLVPMKYFIESVTTGPFAGHNIGIEEKDHELLTAAGIWESWTDKSSGEIVQSFAILTGEPSTEILEAGHDRSPIFLKKTAWTNWLHDSHKGEEWVQFIDENRDKPNFHFIQREALKSFKKQMSFFDE